MMSFVVSWAMRNDECLYANSDAVDGVEEEMVVLMQACCAMRQRGSEQSLPDPHNSSTA